MPTEVDLGDPLVGLLLEGRYRLEERLARGGLSTVYVATDLRRHATVAVKVMAQHLVHDASFVDRFTREARAAAMLSHPNVVSVSDQGSDQGLVYLVMELVRGRTLRDLLAARGRLSVAESFAVLEPVLAGLTAAHRAGIVHRDVKPENVLIGVDGTVKLADFGLARAIVGPGQTRLSGGVLIGTVAYLPPEQLESGLADARSDVYSAGVMLYEMLTGHPPFAGDTPLAVAYQHVHHDVPAPSEEVGGLPRMIDELVARTTRRDPSGRPVDAGAFLAELGHVRTDLAIERVPVPGGRTAASVLPTIPREARADTSGSEPTAVGPVSGTTPGEDSSATSSRSAILGAYRRNSVRAAMARRAVRIYLAFLGVLLVLFSLVFAAAVIAGLGALSYVLMTVVAIGTGVFSFRSLHEASAVSPIAVVDIAAYRTLLARTGLSEDEATDELLKVAALKQT